MAVYNSITYISPSGARIPFETLTSGVINLKRGSEPEYFRFGVTHQPALDAIRSERSDAPGALEFVTPNDDGSPVTLVWRGWHLVRIEPARDDADSHTVTIADPRWRATYRRATLEVNLKWPSGQWRDRSLFFGVPYTTIRALERTLELFGLEYDATKNLIPDDVLNLEAPANLGNSPGGGWVDASFAEIVSKLCEHCACDIVPTLDGKFCIRSRNSNGIRDPLDSLRNRARLQDSTGNGELRFERPKVIRVGFEIQAELALEFNSKEKTVSNNRVIEIENVMPYFGYLEPHGEDRETFYKPLEDVANELGYIPRKDYDQINAIIAKNWFKPFIIAPRASFREVMDGTAEEPLERDKKIWFNDACRTAWRKIWRIKWPKALPGGRQVATPLRRYSAIRFGRLQADGDAQDQGAVFMDYSIEHSIPVNQIANGGRASGLVYSLNYPFDPSQGVRPAPFTARWLVERGDELVFAVTPSRTNRINQEEIFAGLLAQPIGFGNWVKMRVGEPLEFEDRQGSFTPNFRMRVLGFGRLVGPFGLADPFFIERSIFPGKVVGRSFYVERGAFSDGNVSALELKSYETTANFAFSNNQLRLFPVLANEFPENLLNSQDLASAADRIAKEIVQSMMDGKAGVVTTPGVGALANGIFTGGTIKECGIRIGLDGDSFTIVTEFFAMPNFPAFDVDRRSMDGTPAAITAD